MALGACEDTAAGTGGDTLAPADTSVAETSTPTDSAETPEATVATDSTLPGDTTAFSEATVDSAAVPDVDAVESSMPSLPLAGFGAIRGACGVIDTELADPGPSFFVGGIDFGSDPYDDTDSALLTAGGREIIADGNAGGSSLMSEVFAFEVLARCELATLVKTETEVIYDTQGNITDLLVEIDGVKVGVSVTRAVGFPFDAPYTVEQATAILSKKLGDIQISTANVSDGDRWVKQILHIIAYGDAHVTSIETAWNGIDAGLRGDTIVLVTVSDGDDAFIY